MITYYSDEFISCWNKFKIPNVLRWKNNTENVTYDEYIKLWTINCNISLQKYDAHINYKDNKWVLKFNSEEGHTLFLLEWT